MQEIYLVTKNGYGVKVSISDHQLKTLRERLTVGDYINEAQTENETFTA